MTPEEGKRSNRIVDRIILQRGKRSSERDRSGSQVPEYKAMERIENLPQMGFSLFTRGDKRHGFFYHSIDNIDLYEDDDEDEFLSFTHRGKAVTMRGRGLHEVFDAIMDHTLQTLYEYHNGWDAPHGETAVMIDRVQVDSLEDMSAQAAENMRYARQ